MARVTVLPAAQRDFDLIFDYLVASAGSKVAERYAKAFRSTIERLGDFPHLGVPRPKLGSDVRYLVVRPYVIVYTSRDENVWVLRILHGKRNITSDLL